MNLSHHGVVCPACKRELIFQGDFVICQSCSNKYPLVHGIVDLRYPKVEDDSATQYMVSCYTNASFDDLLSIMLSQHQLSSLMYEDTLKYYHNQIIRTQRMTDMFIDVLNKMNICLDNERVLDLGCGSGAGIIALSKRFKQVIGLDSSLAQLLLAKKVIEKTRTDGFVLICGLANCLPFQEKSIQFIQAINVLEHVLEIDPVISEISRTLTTWGTFVADSRNRFDIFFPEPHTGIRFLGFLPRKLIPKYVHWLKKMNYEHTMLLSYRELKTAMNQFFAGENLITFPDVVAYQQPAWINKIIRIIEKIPVLSKMAMWCFPTHIVIGRKTER